MAMDGGPQANANANAVTPSRTTAARRALGAVVVVAASLALLSGARARPPRAPSFPGDAAAVLRIAETGRGATLGGDLDLRGFFREDCEYTFRQVGGARLGHPPEGPREWHVRRVPRPRGRRAAAAGGPGAGEGEERGVAALLVNGVLAFVCVAFAALAAGLTMGLLSLDPLALEIKRRASDDPAERRRSEVILPLLVGHSCRHRLMCSLLLMNSIANEALPLFLDELFPSAIISIVVSVVRGPRPSSGLWGLLCAAASTHRCCSLCTVDRRRWCCFLGRLRPRPSLRVSEVNHWRGRPSVRRPLR